MKKVILMLSMGAALSACAFKDSTSSSSVLTGNLLQSPGPLKLTDERGVLGLMDVMNYPKAAYTVDLTLPVKGRIEYPVSYPQFTQTQCTGAGYTVSYTQQKRSISQTVYLVPFINGVQSKDMVFNVAPTDKLQISVYAQYVAVKNFIEDELLPNEDLNSFQPSSECHKMCTLGLVTPVRPIKQTCYWIDYGSDPSQGGRMTSQFMFVPNHFEQDQFRDQELSNLQNCDPLITNADLKNYYDQLSGSCQGGVYQQMMRNWYLVQMKLPYQRPVYSIDNLADITKSADVSSAVTKAQDQIVHSLREWSN